ncbi:SMP-30/gluconolactonase/LRE family protein [Hyphomicrobium sp.]|jgi:sugar lactone lactonase YvrE|uniref:SMP-30/gluconolactonase/LRE family protein n=1 Tax=Hyphomicrobium sp. TaxID=82 RepID=UPI002BCF8E75|nr:SMP-30/gluconolactonase/LRE family protein [Hyphomicrobium sp.]HVU21443.1 SMP-30/gluconolactonase/LRE family protein [Rhizomicrobium sp.]HVX35931.1 SMP-30/gluconolactonase/LRE family protein [Hyphomicrobium sp.]HVZ03549.1 SMP-30/gluconolactonase/LRE family protein [Hyphomicrobium sp.]
MGNSLAADIGCLWPLRAELGEGLTFDAEKRRIWFVDIKRSRLFCFGLADHARRTWQLPIQISALAVPMPPWTPPTGENVLLAVGQKGYGWLVVEPESVSFTPIADPEKDLPGNRFNDGKLGPDGRFYAGTMDDSEQAATGAVYVLDQQGEVARLDEGFHVTNGPAFSVDGKTFYENDSALGRTYAYDVATGGQLSNKRVLHQFSADEGCPDGMTTDRAGNLWVAMWDGHKIQRLDAEGRKTGAIAVPVQRPTNCVFVGERQLVFTSAAIGLLQKSPEDGGLFAVDILER